MSYSAPSTRAAGYLTDAATNWNQDVVANIIALHDDDSARAYHNTTQSVTRLTNTALALNSERHDVNTLHDTSTNNSRLTAQIAGAYLISGCWGTASGNAGFYTARIRLNGSTYIAQNGMYNNGSGVAVVVHVSGIYKMAVNDYVELVALHTIASGSVTVASTSMYTPELSMQWLGAGT